MTDIIIIGAGPAEGSAAIFSAKAEKFGAVFVEDKVIGMTSLLEGPFTVL
ncbi:hypothetical protein [Paenibacillus sp. IHBB 10380]|nr:hypothetical protein [Paenibacillus sp. IHBB 10380]